jgi:hypothetical protein
MNKNMGWHESRITYNKEVVNDLYLVIDSESSLRKVAQKPKDTNQLRVNLRSTGEHTIEDI